jgi:two-component system nitrate/nitrite response regulator NarL
MQPPPSEVHTGQRLRVIVADDHALLRAGLVACLTDVGNMEVIGEAGDAEEAVRLARRKAPDIVVLDLRMPGGGLQALRRLPIASPEARIIVLTASAGGDDLHAALTTGAAAYVLKGVACEELLRIIRLVDAGGTYAPPGMVWALVRERSQAVPEDALARLSAREREVLGLLSSGLSDRVPDPEPGFIGTPSRRWA